MKKTVIINCDDVSQIRGGGGFSGSLKISLLDLYTEEGEAITKRYINLRIIDTQLKAVFMTPQEALLLSNELATYAAEVLTGKE